MKQWSAGFSASGPRQGGEEDEESDLLDGFSNSHRSLALHLSLRNGVQRINRAVHIEYGLRRYNRIDRLSGYHV